VRIEPTWDWCHGCGFDPEGLRPADWRPGAAPPPATPPQFMPVTPAGAPPSPNRPGAYAPPRANPQTYGYPGYGAQPAQKQGSAGGSVLKVIAFGLAFVVSAVLVAGAVNILGSTSSSKFSRVETASVDDPTIPPTTAPSWSPFTPDDKAYTIDMPGTPSASPVAGDAASEASTIYEYDSVDGTEYLAHSVDAKGVVALANADKAFDATLRSFAQLGITIGLQQRTTVAGFPAENFIGTDKPGNHIQGTMMMSPTRIFILEISTPPGMTADPARYTHFLNSLVIH
jgi:hypothetical protein